jgi:hypothetical protein
MFGDPSAKLEPHGFLGRFGVSLYSLVIMMSTQYAERNIRQHLGDSDPLLLNLANDKVNVDPICSGLLNATPCSQPIERLLLLFRPWSSISVIWQIQMSNGSLCCQDHHPDDST